MVWCRDALNLQDFIQHGACQFRSGWAWRLGVSRNPFGWTCQPGDLRRPQEASDSGCSVLPTGRFRSISQKLRRFVAWAPSKKIDGYSTFSKTWPRTQNCQLLCSLVLYGYFAGSCPKLVSSGSGGELMGSSRVGALAAPVRLRSEKRRQLVHDLNSKWQVVRRSLVKTTASETLRELNSYIW